MQEILEGVWWIRRPMVNVYLVQTHEGLWLVDASTPWDAKALLAALRSLGVERGDLRAILLTHGDFDHVGSAAHLRETLHVPIWVHPADAEAVAGRAPIRRRVVGGLATRLSIALSSRLVHAPPVEPDRTLTDGEMLADGVHVIHTPGHTDGHVCFFDEQRCLLFGGDVVRTSRRRTYRPPFVLADADAQRQTLRKLATLKFDRAVFGHGPPILNDADHLLRAELPALEP
ncbi:MAG: MBL fold metallo-hydrolase [Ardenticatenia bacterium]|nr:MAG: MBL fold metallo-hydrolase [Ardenticatenia bacterium]